MALRSRLLLLVLNIALVVASTLGFTTIMPTSVSSSVVKRPATSSSARTQHQSSTVHRSASKKSRMTMTTIQPGDPDAMPLAPSGVNGKPVKVQGAIVASLFAGLTAGTFGAIKLATILGITSQGWFPTLGPIFIAAGVAHFTMHEDFCRMYPGRNAWGFWNLPLSASFHVNWTGVAEVLGGLGLLLGQVGQLGYFGNVTLFLQLQHISAACLFALVYCVTPANVYMYTHGAQFPEGVVVPVAGHAVRGLAQVVLLTALYLLAVQ